MRRPPITILLLALVLAACGDTAPASLPPTSPAAAADPTLTTAERAGIKTISERAKSMTAAAKDLQALGQEIRATVAWKVKVRTAAQIITGGQKTIAQVNLPAFYTPLAQRTKMVTENCAKPAEALASASVDALSVAMVKAQDNALQRWCITELEHLQLSLDSI